MSGSSQLIKKLFGLVMILALVASFFCAFFLFTDTARAAGIGTGKVVVIDPGHNTPSNSGASCPDGVYAHSENYLNMQLAAQLCRQLQARGYTVYSTLKNSADLSIPYLMDPASNPSNPDRASASATKNPDLYIAVHHNASDKQGWDEVACGTEALYDGGQNPLYVPRSQDLANMISTSVRSLGYTVGNRFNPVKNQGADVLRYNTAPAVTVEAGFVTNHADLANLIDSSKQSAMASKICNAVDQFVTKYPYKIDAPTMQSFYMSTTNPTSQSIFQVNAMGVRAASGIKSLDFRVSNLTYPGTPAKIYHGIDQGAGNYAMWFNLADFSNTPGTYAFEVYAESNSGTTRTLGWTTVEVKGIEMGAFWVSATSPTYKTKIQINAMCVRAPAGVRSVDFKVYPANNPSAAKMYGGGSDGYDNYAMYFDIGDFSYSFGDYVVEVYGIDNNGFAKSLGWTTFTVNKDNGPTMSGFWMSTASMTYQSTFQINAMGVQASSDVKSVDFKVYPADNVSAARTYNGANDGYGNFAMYFSLSDFGNTYGDYVVEATGTSNSGVSKLMGQTTFTVRAIGMSSISVGASNPTYQTEFSISAVGIQAPSGVRSVGIHVYNLSVSGLPDKMYTGTAQGNGTYTAQFNFADFNYTPGTYVAEVYGTANNGAFAALGWTTFTVNKDNGPAMKGFWMGTTNPSYKQKFQINVMGVTAPSGVKSMDFKVYPANNPSAAKMYSGANDGYGNFALYYFDISDFGNTYGGYVVEAYGMSNSGVAKPMGWTTFSVIQDSGPTMKGFWMSTSSPTYQSTFQINTMGVTAPSDVKSVDFKVYPAGNVSAARTYNGANDGYGNFAMYFSLSDFSNTYGNYVVEATGTSNSGVAKLLGQTAFEVKAIGMSSISVGASNLTYQTQFAINAVGLQAPSGIQSVSIKVYSLTDSSVPAKMYNAVNKGNGTYAAPFDIADFNYTFGTYAAEVYGIANNGAFAALGWTTFTVNKDNGPAMKGFWTSTTSPTYSSVFQVNAMGVTALSGVKSVDFKVYPASNPSAVKVYSAVNDGYGNFAMYFDVNDFGNTYDTYIFEASGISNSGVAVKFGSLQVEVKGIGMSGGITFSTGMPTYTMQFQIRANGVQAPSGVQSVGIRVYNLSDSSVPDKMYNGINQGNGTYAAQFSIADFNNKYGIYAAEVYGTANNGAFGSLGWTTFTVNQDIKGPSLSNVYCVNGNPTYNKSLQINALDLTAPSGVQSVTFFMFNEASGRASGKSYSGINQGQNTYAVFPNITTDFGTQGGVFAIEVYATSNSGVSKGIGGMELHVNSGTAIMGSQQATKNQMINFYVSRAKNLTNLSRCGSVDTQYFPTFYGMSLSQFVDIYIQQATAEGVRPEVAFAQMCLETGFLRYTGDVRIEQYNFAGIGATGGGNPGSSFIDVADGALAQIQHLKGYATTAALNKTCVDPRYIYISYGCAPTVEQLGGRWATSSTYGVDMVNNYLNPILAASTMEVLSQEVTAAMLAPVATPTPSPTESPAPTETPVPSETPAPTETATPSPSASEPVAPTEALTPLPSAQAS